MPKSAWSLSANKVWFQFLDTGRYRVSISYTVPALKEFREAHVEYDSKEEAEKVYWLLVKGADFYIDHSNKVKFEPVKTAPRPW
jgi:hypothetical protein